MYKNKRFVLITAILLMNLPNVVVEGIPVPVSGLEVTFLFLAPFIILRLSECKSRFNALEVQARWFCLIPLIMICSSLIGGVVLQSSQLPFSYNISFEESILQSLRRCSYPIVFLSMLLLVRTPSEVRIAWFSLVVGVIAGSFIYVLAREGMMPGISISSSLKNVFAAELMGSGEITSLAISKRFAGTTGSPTVYAIYIIVIALLGVLLTEFKHLHYLFSSVFIVLILFILVLTLSKSVLAAFILCFPLWGLVYLKRAPGFFTLGILSILVVLVVYNQLLEPLSILYDRVTLGGSSSFASRLDRWDVAVGIRQDAPLISWFGHGWQAKQVGYHNEFLEILLSFGFLFTPIVILLTFWNIPNLVLAGLKSTAAVSLVLILFFASFFQTIFLNSFILSILSIWIVSVKIIYDRKKF